MVKTESTFAYLFRFGMMPLMLFSGTFVPLSQLPGWLRLVAYATPLWHGVDLERHLTLGTPTWGLSLIHVVYLLGFAAVGLVAAERSYTRRLVR